MPDYLISIKPNEATEKPTERLVRAKNEARAIAHVVQSTIAVKRATMDDAVACTKAGIELEVAE